MVWYDEKGSVKMELFKEDKIYNFLGKGKIFFVASFVLFFLAIGLIAIKGFSFGIDFTGGTVVQVKYVDVAPIAKIREALAKNKLFEHASVTEFGSPQEIIIKTAASTDGLNKDIGDTTKEILKGTGEFEIRRVDMVGPKVGDELRTKGLTAFLLTLVAIMATVTFRYEWRFALAAIIAAISASGFAAYKLAAVLANTVARQLLGRGLAFGATAPFLQGMSVLTGPIGWAITAVWSAYDLASPGYRVTVPCAIQIAYMRKKMQSVICSSCGVPNGPSAKFCPECGHRLVA